MKRKMNKSYFVGAEVMVDPLTDENIPPHKRLLDVSLRKFGDKPQQAQLWLKTFPPINTPEGQEIKRVVLRLPIGYHERKDIVEQYKKRFKCSHVFARYFMLQDHAGPNNTLVYLDPEQMQDGSDSNQSVPQGSQPHAGPPETTLQPSVEATDELEGKADSGPAGGFEVTLESEPYPDEDRPSLPDEESSGASRQDAGTDETKE